MPEHSGPEATRSIGGTVLAMSVPTGAYRYPNERLVLVITMLLVLVVIAVTASATLCLSAAFITVMVVISFLATRSHHRNVIAQAIPVTPQTAPALARIVSDVGRRIRIGPYTVYVAPVRALNAYTFGLVPPYTVVMYAGLLDHMDRDELRFIIGHELGHIHLGHTWLNSLVGGMAGIPSPFAASALLAVAFLWWNRMCEFSADRAGLLACGNPDKAISALVRLTQRVRDLSGEMDLEGAMRRVEQEDDHTMAGLAEVLSTHPMTIRRIEKLRAYAQTPQYRRLQQRIHAHSGSISP
ncbi:MAG: M48 family metallopeptidase [Chloroflexi bacterium]|nr:M48 family metallopeptidase [Chloroflexota bacterium]